MTVQELIAILSIFDKDAEVFIHQLNAVKQPSKADEVIQHKDNTVTIYDK